jgi:hypothetical protein
MDIKTRGNKVLQKLHNEAFTSKRRRRLLYGDGFMDFIHRPKRKILKIKITTFRKLALLPSSGEWRGRKEEHLLSWAP